MNPLSTDVKTGDPHPVLHNEERSRLNVITTLLERNVYYVPEFGTLAESLAAAGKAGGGVVLLPPGITELSTSLNVPAGVTLRGHGSRSSIIKVTGSIDGAVLRLYHNNYDGGVQIQDLTISGQDNAQQGIALEHTAGNRIERVAISGCINGLQLSDTWINCSRDCNISQCAVGVLIDSASTQVNCNVFDTLSVHYCTQYGVLATGGTTNRFHHCAIEHNAVAGVYQRAGQLLTLAYCHFEANGTVEARGSHIVLEEDGIQVRTPHITGCYFWGGVLEGSTGYTDHAIKMIGRIYRPVFMGNLAMGHAGDTVVYGTMQYPVELGNSWQT